MEVLVTGASGYVGSSLVENLSRNHHVQGTYLTKEQPGLYPLDVTDGDQVEQLLLAQRPDIVIHAAGMTGAADDNVEAGWEVNVRGTEHVVAVARKIGARVIFLSSAAVFNGQEGSSNEEAIPASRGMYGQTKIVAEKIVQGSGLPYLIVRPSLVVGTAPYGTEGTYFGRVEDAIVKKSAVELDGKWRFTPSWNKHIADAIEWWLQNPKATDLLHITTTECTTQLDFARRLGRACGLNTNNFYPEDTQSFKSNILDGGRAYQIGAVKGSLEAVIQGIAFEIIGKQLA